MRTDPVNVFGHLTPASPAMLEAARAVLTSWQLEAELSLEGDVLRLAFEGVYFPGEELRDALQPELQRECGGKIDVIDRESWTLTRHLCTNGTWHTFTVGLNHVLDYSGH